MLMEISENVKNYKSIEFLVTLNLNIGKALNFAAIILNYKIFYFNYLFLKKPFQNLNLIFKTYHFFSN